MDGWPNPVLALEASRATIVSGASTARHTAQEHDRVGVLNHMTSDPW